MEHFLKLGNKRKHVDKLRKLQDSGVRVKSLESEETIHPAGEWLWRAFEELASKRTWNEGGPHAIQTTEIYAYAKYHSIPPGILREDLYYIVSILDQQYISHVRKDREKEQRKQALRSKTRSRVPRRPRRGRR